jgi:hypothetical protein
MALAAWMTFALVVGFLAGHAVSGKERRRAQAEARDLRVKLNAAKLRAAITSLSRRSERRKGPGAYAPSGQKVLDVTE